jgi:hypothetical protein
VWKWTRKVGDPIVKEYDRAYPIYGREPEHEYHHPEHDFACPRFHTMAADEEYEWSSETGEAKDTNDMTWAAKDTITAYMPRQK